MRALPRIPRMVPVGKRRTNYRLRPKHHEFIRQLPCLACGKAAPSECAHIRSSGDGGMGIKPHSRFTVPLCHDCHINNQHRVGEQAFYNTLGIDPLDVSLKLWTVTGDIDAGERIIFRAHQAIVLHRSISREAADNEDRQRDLSLAIEVPRGSRDG